VYGNSESAYSSLTWLGDRRYPIGGEWIPPVDAVTGTAREDDFDALGVWQAQASRPFHSGPE